MPASPARKRKRAVEAGVRRGVKRKPSVDLVTKPELESLVEKFNEGLKLLSDNQEKLGKNVNQNLGAVQGAFHFVDAHQHVSRRIMNDMAMGRLQMVVDAEGNPELIDYEWYYRRYQWHRYVVLFIRWLKKYIGYGDDDEEENEEEAAPDEELADDFTFGGDYANQDSP